MNKCAFTICAKNYMAQAITLKKSFKKYNEEVDFFIFLSDLTEDGIPTDAVLLNDSWIPGWEDMAFKYDVIEFSTAIKPFCFNKLFNEGYDKVIYLDPDIYVTNKLDYIYAILDTKSIVLSPHYCKIQEHFTGGVSEETLLFVGIYNLGFGAIKKTDVGKTIVTWWMNRLQNKCYIDRMDALHVDQKWLDFIPCFFPNDVEITHHPGINPAVWNLHERELVIKDGQYRIKYIDEEKDYPLLFFHFSGFDPFNKTILNRRHPQFNIERCPSFKPLIDEYVDAEYANGYEKYAAYSYAFNNFSNGEKILPINRRLYRQLFEGKKDNLFDVSGDLYQYFKKNKLLSNVYGKKSRSGFSPAEAEKKDKYKGYVGRALKFAKSLLGVRYYSGMLQVLQEYSRMDKQVFLVQDKAKNDKQS